MPISVGLSGPGSAQYRPFYRDFLEWLSSETGIDIALGAPPYDIHVRFVPGASYQALLPTVQCNLLFWQPDWKTFLRGPTTGKIEGGSEPLRMGVFAPDTLEPHKIRDCLIEETVQAMGPINDFFGLGPTIFNDDNAHRWPTRLDVLMLQVLYHPDLDPDQGRDGLRRQARRLLDVLNPQGRGALTLPRIRQASFLTQRDRIVSLGRQRDKDVIYRTARDIDRVTQRDFPGSAYACVTRSLAARSADAARVPTALAEVDAALQLCRRIHGDEDPRIATLLMTKSFALRRAGRPAEALAAARQALPIMLAHGHDDRVAAAKTLILLGRLESETQKPGRAELDDLRRWMAYAFGEDHDLSEKLAR